MRFLKRSLVLYCFISIRIIQGAGKRTAETQNGEEQRLEIKDGTKALIIARLECPSSSATADLMFYEYQGSEIGRSRWSLNRCGIGYVTHVQQQYPNTKFNLTFWGPKEGFGDVNITVENQRAYHVNVSSDERVFWTVCDPSNHTCYLDAMYKDFPSTRVCSNQDVCNDESITKHGIIIAVSVACTVIVIGLICISVYTCHLRQQLKRERNTRKPLDAIPVQDESAPRQQMEQMQPTDNRRFSDFSANSLYGWINPINHEQSSHDAGMQQ